MSTLRVQLESDGCIRTFEGEGDALELILAFRVWLAGPDAVLSMAQHLDEARVEELDRSSAELVSATDAFATEALRIGPVEPAQVPATKPAPIVAPRVEPVAPAPANGSPLAPLKTKLMNEVFSVSDQEFTIARIAPVARAHGWDVDHVKRALRELVVDRLVIARTVGDEHRWRSGTRG